MAEHIEYNGNFSGSQIDTLLTKIQSSQVFTTEEKTKLASLVNYDDTEVKEDISDIETSLNSHKSDKANPHEVTKAQVGLGNVDNTSDANKPISTATQAALNNKVNKVDGKGLSTNDFTDEDKEQITKNKDGVATVANGGSKNIIEPTLTAPSTKENVTCTPNADGTFTLNGTFPSTSTKSSEFFVVVNGNKMKEISDKYGAINIICSGGSSVARTQGRLRFYHIDTLNESYDSSETDPEISITLSDNINQSDANISIVIYRGQSYNNVVIKPMIRDASIEDDTYQPYAPTNRELYDMILALQSGS